MPCHKEAYCAGRLGERPLLRRRFRPSPWLVI